MYLVDTSVWVDYLRGRDRPHVGFLRDLLSNPRAVGITHHDRDFERIASVAPALVEKSFLG